MTKLKAAQVETNETRDPNLNPDHLTLSLSGAIFVCFELSPASPPPSLPRSLYRRRRGTCSENFSRKKKQCTRRSETLRGMSSHIVIITIYGHNVL